MKIMLEKENQIVVNELPLYKKGKEIYDLIDKICQLIETHELFLGRIKDSILNTARILLVKVVAVEAEQKFRSKFQW